ncbi:MAG: uroporphyrinogen-III synthase [Ilumatobacteraceae bacterium]
MSSVLNGRRVVVTRALEQADELATLLQQFGAVPVVIPLIEIATEPAGAANLASVNMADFDWLIITSPNGAAHVVDAHAGRAGATQVAAVGKSTADVLRAGGIKVALVPAVQSAAGLLAEFSEVGRILVVQAANADDSLADGLRAHGSVVTVVAPYRTVPARVTAGQQLAALSADAVLFASGSAARAWADVFGDSAPPLVVAIGPKTAAAVTDAGLKVSVVAADHSLSGMVLALESHLSSQR